VTLDDGRTWRLADIVREHKPNAWGRHWAWVWWRLRVPLAHLLRCPEVRVRAWDSSQNTQPDALTWNVMGMMNNCSYRVKVHPEPCAGGGFGLRFEHPTLAGATPGGWMNPVPKEEETHAAVVATVASKTPATVQGATATFTMEEIERHDTKDSAWFVVSGRVFDATPFLKEHPGGADSILLVAGTDATDEFNAIHSSNAKAMLEQYCIGVLASEENAIPVFAPPTPAVIPEAPVALNPKRRLRFPLVEKHELSHNVRRFRFALPSPAHRFGLPVGKHVFLYATVNGELVLRAYTPTSSDADLGHFDLVVKVYRAGEHPRFPDGGKMSQYLDSMALGDTIEVKGPTGHVEYLGRGRLLVDGVEQKVPVISMIAGGTGITPMYQVITAVLADPEDTTRLALLYANQTPDDVLLREELDSLAAAHPDRLKVWYTVDRVPDEEAKAWPYSIGFVGPEMVAERLLPSGEGAVCFMCGPPPMIKFACLPALEKVGYAPEECIQF
jgi:nitrate reductase (NAD(P)H)